LVPDGVELSEAVVCEGAWYAQTYLEAFGLQPGDRILIYGASGAIGTAAVQLAKYYGAEVTAVVSTRHLDLLESLGADRVIDYTAEDFAAIGQTFNYVLDAVGKTTYFRCRRLLGRNDTFSASDLGPFWQNIALSAWSRAFRNRRFVFPMPKADRQFISFLGERLAAREFRAVIDRKYSLDEIPQAFRYVETASKTGIVVVNVSA
jgi:NADPH:quinone reductase-like Zn-dependent oxidoreductase